MNPAPVLEQMTIESIYRGARASILNQPMFYRGIHNGINGIMSCFISHDRRSVLVIMHTALTIRQQSDDILRLFTLSFMVCPPHAYCRKIMSELIHIFELPLLCLTVFTTVCSDGHCDKYCNSTVYDQMIRVWREYNQPPVLPQEQHFNKIP